MPQLVQRWGDLGKGVNGPAADRLGEELLLVRGNRPHRVESRPVIGLPQGQIDPASSQEGKRAVETGLAVDQFTVFTIGVEAPLFAPYEAQASRKPSKAAFQASACSTAESSRTPSVSKTTARTGLIDAPRDGR